MIRPFGMFQADPGFHHRQVHQRFIGVDPAADQVVGRWRDGDQEDASVGRTAPVVECSLPESNRRRTADFGNPYAARLSGPLTPAGV